MKEFSNQQTLLTRQPSNKWSFWVD